MAKQDLGSSNSYTGDSSTSLFSISFALGTINIDRVKVYLDDILKTNITDYTIINNNSQIQFTTAPETGVTIDIRREQDDNSVEIDYQDTKQVKEVSLDNSNKALYYLIHELFDGWLGKRFKLRKNLDANNKKIINLKDPTDDQDAVTYKIAKGLISAQPISDATEVFAFSFLGSQNTSDNLTYDLSSLVTVDIVQITIFINGVKQITGDSFIVSGTDVVFSELIDDTDTLDITVNLNTLIAQVVAYVLPAATASALGGIKVGANLAIDGVGVLSATYSIQDGELSEINFTSGDHTKLNGIATGATNVTNNNQITNGAGYQTTQATRASLGIATTDNVTFADINVGTVDTTGTIKISNSSYRQIVINRGDSNLVGFSANGTQGSTLQLEASDGTTTATALFTKLGDLSGINNLNATTITTGSFLVTTVPSASGLGAGTSIYVTDETGGSVLATSDGTNWRRSTDRVIVS